MDKKDSSRRSRSLGALALGNALDNADGNVMVVLGPYLMKALHMDIVALGWIHAIGRISRMVFGPLWALAGDRFDRRILMFIVTGLWGIWTILAGTVQTATMFFVFYGIAAVGTVATEPLTSSLVPDLYPEKERGQAYGVLRSVGYFVLIVMTPLAVLFTQYGAGWRWILYTLGGLSMLSGLLILFTVRDPGRGVTEALHVPGERLQKGDLRFLFRTPSIWWMALAMMLLTSVVGTQFYTLYFNFRTIGQNTANLILAAYLSCFAVSVLFGGRLGDFAHRKAGHAGRILLMQVYLVAFAALAAVCLLVKWSVLGYFIVFSLFGLVSGVGTPACVLPLISAVSLPETRSTAFGFLLSFVQGASLAALSVLLPILQKNLGWSHAFLWIIVIPYFINAMVWFVFYRSVPRDHDRVQNELKRRAEVAESVSKD